MPSLKDIEPTLASVVASEQTKNLLRDLHTQALTEGAFLSTDAQPYESALSKFVALDPDKCALVYLLLRASGAKNVVEAGTSFGLSTIYLALAVAQNAALRGDGAGKVIATENEPTKAMRARQYWKDAGDDVDKWIELREGDIRETLKTDLKEVDFLLLDIWTPLVRSIIETVYPKLRVGATIVADNTTAAASGYGPMFEFLNDPANGFRWTSAPYDGGLLVAVYVGRPQ